MPKDFSDSEVRDAATDWELRVVREREELAKKIVDLQTFIVGPDFYFVDYVVKDLMRDQLQHMQDYERVLRARISRF